MKKIGFIYSAITLSLVSIAFINSCVQLKDKSNPYDPNNPNYKASSNAVVSGWKIDTTTGFPSSPSLRCINVPNGASRRITFTIPTSGSGAATFITNHIRQSGFGGANVKVTVFATNGIGTEAAGITNTFSAVDSGSFSPYFSLVSGWSSASANAQITVTVENMGDADGSNTIWVDKITLNMAGIVLFQSDFTGMTDSQLTGDKEQ